MTPLPSAPSFSALPYKPPVTNDHTLTNDDMTHEMVTNLNGQEVLERAKRFFAERIPHNSAFLEREGTTFATFRGQGGEELTLAVFAAPNGGTRIRASTLFFDQAIGRFFSTLPLAEEIGT